MKKASVTFIPIVSFAAILAIIFFYVNFVGSIDHLDNLPAGVYQSAIWKANQNGENILFYLDQSAILAAPIAYYKLANNGGFIDVGGHSAESCGSYVYPLWNTPTKDCIPDAVENYKKQLDYELGLYLGRYPFNNLILNHEYEIIDDGKNITVLGKAKSPFVISIDFSEGRTIIQKCSVSITKIPASIKCEDNNCALNTETTEKLIKTAENLASKGYTIQITSSHRTFEDQQLLWDERNCDNNPLCGVSFPSCDSPHLKGGAIDIAIFKDGSMLDAGEYDPYTGNPKQFELSEIANQKLIEKLMCDNGWIRWGSSTNRLAKGEWWHYEYGTPRAEQGSKAGVCAT